ncbi:hypothetical protein [uncultured Mitsuokella sp.]|uniref:hypothetical protein n=1 Tax=uncultured Mitsuokella sp. TaxID=453120 RepID=UPI0026130671|nr:hypothetical protein [uncultured Mitsuokella sp.]
MVTELLAALIFVGAVLVFVGRFYAHRKAKPEQERKERENLVVSTERLKEELSRSADVIVARMEEHVEQLDGMLQEADAKNSVFEALLRESEENRKALEASLQAARETVQKLREQQEASAAQIRSMERVVQALPAQDVPFVPPPPPIPMDAAATYEGGAPAAEPAPTVTEREDAAEFAAVLQNSIERDAVGEETSKTPLASTIGQVREAEKIVSPPSVPPLDAKEAKGTEALTAPRGIKPAPVGAEAQVPPRMEAPAPKTAEGPHEATTADRARALLLSGIPVEEVSRQTGMGKGAVELVKEMSRRQLAQ